MTGGAFCRDIQSRAAAGNVVNIMRQMGDVIQRSGVGSGAQNKTLTPEAMASMTKEQLKAECRRRGQKASGNKIELLSRLGYYKLAAQAGGVQPHQTAVGGEGQHESAGAQQPGQARSAKSANGSSTKDSSHRNGGETFHNSVKDHRGRTNSMDNETSLVLWKRPLTTLEYFGRELLILMTQAANRLAAYKSTVLAFVSLVLFSLVIYQIQGPHQPYMQSTLTLLLWWSWWVVLGVLSSVGLGTGLHTFLLYLGPHIARVTLAAYECNALNFPQPPYPNEIICPTEIDEKWPVTVWNIMSKVRVEAMLWGIGTALGELPPYFMARAARLSSGGKKSSQLLELDAKDESLTTRAKIVVQRLVEKVGFLGILACASIPNPLFDLAGLTCGHFLVPFWTFFGATVIGKAVIKMHIQKMFVIVAFNETLIGQALSWVKTIPHLGPKLEAPLLEFLRNQKSHLHRNDAAADTAENQGSFLSGLLEKFVLAMVLFFVVSIINSLAQSYQKRASKGGRKGKKLKD